MTRSGPHRIMRPFLDHLTAESSPSIPWVGKI